MIVDPVAILILGVMMIAPVIAMIRTINHSNNRVLDELGKLSEQLHEDQRATQHLLAGGRPEQIGKELRRSIEPLVREVGGLSNTIGSALGQTGVAAQQMNASSANLQAITDQFGSAARELRQSQELLQQALRQLAQPNALPEWLGQLHETVGPLRSAGAQIGQHYQYNRDLLDTTQVLLNSWNEQGEQVVLGARTINDAFQQWSSEEAVARQQFSEQLDLRLDEVGRMIKELATGLNSLNHTVQRLATATDAMQHSSDVSRNALSQLLSHQASNQEQQQRAVETLSKLGQRMSDHGQTLGAQLSVLVENSRRLSEESSESQQKTQHQIAGSLNQMVDGFQKTHRSLHEQLLDTTKRLHEVQRAASMRDEQIFRTYDKMAKKFPNVYWQVAQVVLFVLILVAIIWK